MPPETDFRLSIRRFVRGCFGVFLVLLALHLAAIALWHGFGHPYVKGFVPMFNFAEERNVPTFYSSALLLMAAGLSAMVAASGAPMRRRWWLVAAALGYVALDEFAAIHERFADPLREALHTSGFFYFAWIVPYGAAVAVLGLALLTWLLRLPARTRTGFIVSAAVYLFGAVVMEGFEGWYLGGDPARLDLVHGLLTTVEESCEMLGALLFIRTALRHIRSAVGARLILED